MSVGEPDCLPMQRIIVSRDLQWRNLHKHKISTVYLKRTFYSDILERNSRPARSRMYVTMIIRMAITNMTKIKRKVIKAGFGLAFH